MRRLAEFGRLRVVCGPAPPREIDAVVARSAFRLQRPSDLRTPTGTQPMRLQKKCEWKRGDEARTWDSGNRKKTMLACHFLGGNAVDHGHPSRLPCGSLRSAWTEPGRDPSRITDKRKWQSMFWPLRWIRLPLVGTEHSADYDQVLQTFPLTSTGLLMEAHYHVLVHSTAVY